MSKPPHATKLPEGAYAQVITQDERRGIAWTCRRVTINNLNKIIRNRTKELEVESPRGSIQLPELTLTLFVE